jgi:hypothetical protein
MKTRSRLALLVAMALVFATGGAAFAAVGTDQADYVPGSTVTISGDNSDGAGYVPGETVSVAVAGPNGYAASCDAVVGDDGGWSCAVTLWGDESAVGDYSYTATSASGVTQSGAFTDAVLSKTDVLWDGNGTNVDGTCETFEDDPDLTPGPGQMGWLFILTSPYDGLGSTLTAKFSDNAVAQTVAGFFPGGGDGSYHYIVYTALGATLESASATDGTFATPPDSIRSVLTVSHCEDGTEAPEVSVSGLKYYDANTNGQFDPGEVGIGNWPIDYTDGTSATLYTESDGTFTIILDPDSYVFGEQQAGAPWMQTGNLVDQSSNSSLQGDKTYSFILGDVDVTGINFGNVCVGGGGGRTLGFWSNKNGKALFGSGDLALMVSLNLRNANGTPFNPASYPAFRTWLLNATATNMAYMLSAQLAAMELNVYNGLVDGTALIYAPGTLSANVNGFATVNAVMAEADSALGLDGLVLAGDSNRGYYEALKNALDKANNNLTFVQPDPDSCPAPVFAPTA